MCMRAPLPQFFNRLQGMLNLPPNGISQPVNGFQPPVLETGVLPTLIVVILVRYNIVMTLFGMEKVTVPNLREY